MKWLSRYVYQRWDKRFLIFLFDLVGGLLCLPWQGASKHLSYDPSAIRKILVIRNDHLGDILMTRPALGALTAGFPKAQVDLLIASEAASLFEGSGEIHRLIPFKNHWFSSASAGAQWKEACGILKQIRENRYDMAVDFRGDLRNILLMAFAGIPRRIGYGITGGGFLLTRSRPYDRGRHQVQMNQDLLACLGISGQPSQKPWVLSEERKNAFWKSIPRPENAPAKIIVHPSAGYPSKRWPYENYEKLIRGILDKGLGSVTIIGTEKEKEEFPLSNLRHPSLLDLRGKTKVADLPILFEKTDLYVGNDSGPAHIAAAQNVPLVILFSGANDPRIWRPWSDKLTLLTHTVPCSPCEAKVCPLGHHHCMTEITVEQVFEAVLEKILEKSKFKTTT